MTKLSDYARTISSNNDVRFKLLDDNKRMTRDMCRLINETLTVFRTDSWEDYMSPNMQVRVIEELISLTNTPYIEIKNIVNDGHIEIPMNLYYKYADGKFYIWEDIPSEDKNEISAKYKAFETLSFDVDRGIINRLKEII